MTIEAKGPGGVGNSYGQRSTNTPSQINSGKPKDVYNEFGTDPVTLNPTAILTRPLNVVTFGPSISQYGFYDTATANNYQYPKFSEVAYLMGFTGPMLMQTLIGGKVANRTDDCGNYGYSSQESNTLLTDSETNWVPQLATANYKPDMIDYTGLVTNDIFLTFDTEVIKKRVLTVLRAHKARWPGLIQVLPTPHPDARLTTATQKACFLALRLWMLTLDNGNDLLVPDLSGPGSYAQPGDLTQPLPYYAYNTVAGTIDALGDVYGVHPQPRGCQVNAKIKANKIKMCISSKLPTLSQKFLSLNPTLTGSAAFTTNASGTAPSPGTFTQAVTMAAGAACVGTVAGLEPWTVTFTPDTAVGGVVTNGHFVLQSTGAGANPGTVEFGSITKLRIVSGARSILGIQGACTSVDGGNLTSRGGATASSKQFYPAWDGGPSGYADGDIVWGISPRRTLTVAPTITYSQLTVDIGQPVTPVVCAILQMGYLTT